MTELFDWLKQHRKYILLNVAGQEKVSKSARKMQTRLFLKTPFWEARMCSALPFAIYLSKDEFFACNKCAIVQVNSLFHSLYKVKLTKGWVLENVTAQKAKLHSGRHAVEKGGFSWCFFPLFYVPFCWFQALERKIWIFFMLFMMKTVWTNLL